MTYKVKNLEDIKKMVVGTIISLVAFYIVIYIISWFLTSPTSNGIVISFNNELLIGLIVFFITILGAMHIKGVFGHRQENTPV